MIRCRNICMINTTEKRTLSSPNRIITVDVALGLLDYHSRRYSLIRSEGKAEDVQIEWTEAEVYSNIDLDLSFD